VLVDVTRTIEFATSLRYRRGDLSEAENRELFGVHANRHGHNYRLDVTLRGETDPVTGMVINLTDLKAILEEVVMSRFDHKDLNDDTDLFEKRPPTPENVALVIWELLEEAVPNGLLARVRLHAGADTTVEVAAGA